MAPWAKVRKPLTWAYDSSEKMYTYDSFNTLGEVDHAKGNLDGDTWTWQSETRMGSQTIKGRLTIKVLSATAYNSKFEKLPDGTTWNDVLEGKTRRNRWPPNLQDGAAPESGRRNGPLSPFEQRYLAAAAFVLARQILTPADGKRRLFNPEP
jgi:hypothetical protein